MLPALMLNMSWRPFCEVVTARLVLGQISMLPPRSSLRVAACSPAEIDEPLMTLVPELASTTAPFTLASEAKSSPTFCCAPDGRATATDRQANTADRANREEMNDAMELSRRVA